ncbi:DUF21 domain-containing protein [Camellia lanceoleosa]|uniref:DUF21 domain-containing protein n=1 Tax=Camellia lanceoleosa TaxID=1840588 RepID=A0ACC0IQX2_9ERIC|nr:DUF21 domain-containing protein [Camellia lanceoleosa]
MAEKRHYQLSENSIYCFAHCLYAMLLPWRCSFCQTLPIFLDSLVTTWGAILISVTLILLFGEIIPQSVCSRYGLAIGAAVAPFVRVLVWICFPVAYPISKLLDFLLGHGHVALFHRTKLKTLVDLHGNEVENSHMMRQQLFFGALGLLEKIASDAMTPISTLFFVDINAKLDRELMNLILEKGHRRVPVYYEQPTNIIGLLLVNCLFVLHKLDRSTLECVRLQERNMALAKELATLKLARGHQINAFVLKFKEQGMKMKFRKHIFSDLVTFG